MPAVVLEPRPEAVVVRPRCPSVERSLPADRDELCSRCPAPTATGAPTPKASVNTRSARPSAASTPRAAPATSTTASSAGRTRPGTTYQGVATAYETSRVCGAYVHVRAANGAAITVRITNECPLPCAPGQLDLSRQAFADLADLKVGRIPITWSLVSLSTSPTGAASRRSANAIR
ncbi:RlpA-like double-psi beta-barrel domain-containing protein [Streptomyces sp. NPDC059467]|uniref:RlpA-like double-psi beta-barrel domain-containing protein n=1 Tax=Streptomyces sp. NPDC059467 TaxID=3346844 RepID=UPI00369D4262